MGFDWEDVAADYEVFEAWPDNHHAILLFGDLTTQWRVGPSGPYGLDYSAIPSVFEMNLIKKKEWPEMLKAIKIMESEALKEMRN